MVVLLHSLIKKPQEPIPAHKASMKGFDEHFLFFTELTFNLKQEVGAGHKERFTLQNHN